MQCSYEPSTAEPFLNIMRSLELSPEPLSPGFERMNDKGHASFQDLAFVLVAKGKHDEYRLPNHPLNPKP